MGRTPIFSLHVNVLTGRGKVEQAGHPHAQQQEGADCRQDALAQEGRTRQECNTEISTYFTIRFIFINI